MMKNLGSSIPKKNTAALQISLYTLTYQLAKEIIYLNLYGADNLAANFSRELADYIIYIIDVSAGDKIPRKGGPGITQADLLVRFLILIAAFSVPNLSESILLAEFRNVKLPRSLELIVYNPRLSTRLTLHKQLELIWQSWSVMHLECGMEGHLFLLRSV